MFSKKPEIELRKETPAASHEGWPSMLSFRKEIDRMFDDFAAGIWRDTPLLRRHEPFAASPGTALRPATELVECDGEYRITAELPGMRAEDIDIRLGEGTITLRGEKSEDRTEEKADYLVSERRYGEFQRSLSLPPGIDTQAVTADFADGVLTVTLPKTPEAKQKERKVTVSSAV